jgi:hypothetical protein
MTTITRDLANAFLPGPEARRLRPSSNLIKLAKPV